MITKLYEITGLTTIPKESKNGWIQRELSEVVVMVLTGILYTDKFEKHLSEGKATLLTKAFGMTLRLLFFQLLIKENLLKIRFL